MLLLKKTNTPKLLLILSQVVFWLLGLFDNYHSQNEMDSNHLINFVNACIIISTEILIIYWFIYGPFQKFKKDKNYLVLITKSLFILLTGTFTRLVLQDIDVLIRKGRHMKSFTLYVCGISHLADSGRVLLLFFSVAIIRNLYLSEKEKNRKEKEQLENELNFLKAQINPHFLFNAINSIYVLIDEDSKLASKTLLQFSGMLRYQLYDCSKAFMPLDREIQFLKDYVELQRLRINNTVSIDFEAINTDQEIGIAPFILIAFVENAFKHLSQFTNNSFITISIKLENKTLSFLVSNSYEPNEPSNNYKTEGGIGLPNVLRRLELLYKDKHKYLVSKTSNVYTTELILDLYEDELLIS